MGWRRCNSTDVVIGLGQLAGVRTDERAVQKGLQTSAAEEQSGLGGTGPTDATANDDDHGDDAKRQSSHHRLCKCSTAFTAQSIDGSL